MPLSRTSHRPRRLAGLAKQSLFSAALLPVLASHAFAWSNHTLLTWQAVADMPQIHGQSVTAESLDDFLSHEASALPAVLDKEEKWSRDNLRFYAPRPDALRFTGTQTDAAALALSFRHALRINETMPLELYVQRAPGVTIPAEQIMPWSSASVLKKAEDMDSQSLERVTDGASLNVLDVVATGSNEPDLGLDIGLWQDNGQKQGMIYGFGPQSFGNPHLDYGSQAPFHMGFYHEAGIIYEAAPYLQHCYPEARIHLFLTLSQFAFEHGHPYWGWRFAGWAIHYVQDLGQPYHARVLPGVSVASMLWTSALDMMGHHAAKLEALSRVTNRHIVLENYQYHRMTVAYAQTQWNDPLLAALRDTSGDSAFTKYDIAAPRAVISTGAAADADTLDAQLAASFPADYVSGHDAPALDNGTVDMYRIALQQPESAQAKLTSAVAARMRQVGRDTRAVVRSLDIKQSPAATPG